MDPLDIFIIIMITGIIAIIVLLGRENDQASDQTYKDGYFYPTKGGMLLITPRTRQMGRQAFERVKELEHEVTKLNNQKSKLEDEVKGLGGQIRDLTGKLEQLEASKNQKMAKAIKTERAKLQTDFDLRKQALEPKIRAEVKAEYKAKFEKRRAEFNDKINTFVSTVMEGDEELIRLFNVSPRFDTLAVLMKAKGDKSMLADLRIAAGLGPEHFEKEVEIKFHKASTQGKGGRAEGALRSTDAQILALLKEQPLGHGQIVQLAGMPKSTVSDVIGRLKRTGLVGQDPETGRYYAL